MAIKTQDACFDRLRTICNIIIITLILYYLWSYKYIPSSDVGITVRPLSSAVLRNVKFLSQKSWMKEV